MVSLSVLPAFKTFNTMSHVRTSLVGWDADAFGLRMPAPLHVLLRKVRAPTFLFRDDARRRASRAVSAPLFPPRPRVLLDTLRPEDASRDRLVRVADFRREWTGLHFGGISIGLSHVVDLKVYKKKQENVSHETDSAQQQGNTNGSTGTRSLSSPSSPPPVRTPPQLYHARVSDREVRSSRSSYRRPDVAAEVSIKVPTVGSESRSSNVFSIS